MGKNPNFRIRVRFWFFDDNGSVLFRYLHIFFTFEFGFGSVLGKTWVLVRFVLAGFGFFPISNLNTEYRLG